MKRDRFESGFPDAVAQGESPEKRCQAEDNDVLLAKITPCFENGKLGIAKNLINGVGFGSSEYIVLRPSSKIISKISITTLNFLKRSYFF